MTSTVIECDDCRHAYLMQMDDHGDMGCPWCQLKEARKVARELFCDGDGFSPVGRNRYYSEYPWLEEKAI